MVGTTLAVIADYNYLLGDYAQAEAIALEHFKRWQPPRFDMLAYYAKVQIIKGDYQTAQQTLRRMLAQTQEPNAPLDMMETYLFAQSFMAYYHGDYALAMAYADKAFALQPDDKARFGRTFYVAQSLNKLGQAKRAETLLREAIEGLKQTERAFELATFKSALGESLTLQHRFAEAETALLEAYDAQKSRVLPQQDDFVQTRRRLAELYRAWGKADEAQKYE